MYTRTRRALQCVAVNTFVVVLVLYYVLGQRIRSNHRDDNSNNEPILVFSELSERTQPAISTELAQSTIDTRELAQSTIDTRELAQSTIDTRESAFVDETDSAGSDVKVTMESQGYIFPYSVYEEQTCGARNVWQLQVLAKEIGMNVVEPFVADSMFRMNGAAPNFDQVLRFRDYFDKDKWDRMAIANNIKPLVSWEEFLSKAPRNAIILYTAIRLDRKEPLIFTADADDDSIKKYNFTRDEKIVKNDLQWIKSNFIITKVVYYLTSLKLHPMTISNLSYQIFGGANRDQVTLIIVNWLGIRKTRVELQGTSSSFVYLVDAKFNYVPDDSRLQLELSPSQRIIKAYETYINKFIGDHKYVGIIFRTHTVLEFSPKYRTFGDRSKYLLQCSRKLSAQLDRIRNKWKIFLGYDMGTFGSKGYYNSTGDKRLFSLRDQILIDVYKGDLNVAQREEMLMEASDGITDTGFMAQLEKVIATNAHCIVLLGPNSQFVNSAATAYMSLHPTNRCIVSICSGDYRNASGKVISSHSIESRFLY